METMTLDQAIDAVMQLPPEQQDMLIDIVQHRRAENRRKEIARSAREAIAAYRAGELKPQSVPDIIAELRQSLDEESGE